MMAKKMMNLPLRLMCIFALAASATGCIESDLSDCNSSYRFTVRAYADTGSELTQEDVRDVSLYVFDDDLCFTELIETQIGQTVAIDAPERSGLHIVVWGNLGGGSQDVTASEEGDHKDEHAVTLIGQTRADDTYHTSPDDLFHGEVTVTVEQLNDSHVVPIYRAVGSMAVTLLNAREFTGFDDGDFSIVVHTTNSAIDFYGAPVEGAAAYRPTGSFVDGKYFVPAFNLIPGQSEAIDIYHGTELLASVSQDSEGNPIAVEKDKLTNVSIRLQATLGVSVSVTPWGEYAIGKEF